MQRKFFLTLFFQRMAHKEYKMLNIAASLQLGKAELFYQMEIIYRD